jgi:hypothetical protein
VDTNLEIVRAEGKTLWHIILDLTYEGGNNDSCQDGVDKVLSAMRPLVENDSGIKEVIIYETSGKSITLIKMP